MKNTFSIDQSPTADEFNAASNCPVPDITEAPVPSASEAHSILVKQIDRMIYESKQKAFSGLLGLIDDVRLGHTIGFGSTRSGMSFPPKTLIPEAMPMNTSTEKPTENLLMDQLGDEHIENPIAVINALQKQIEHLEEALRRQNDFNRNSFGLDMRSVLLVLRAHAIIPLYLGKEARNEVLEPSDFVYGSVHPYVTDMTDALREQLWMLDDAPVPDEMKEALREAAKHGGQRWEFQTSSHSQQV